MKLAPIVLFTYNRLQETIETIKALQQNHLASASELFVFSDASKNLDGRERVEEIRNYLKTIDGFKRIEIIEAKENKGLAKSVIEGVSKILDQYEEAIVIEDDLVTAPNFLDFMNEALVFYRESAEVMSISGYTLDLPSLNGYSKDYYVGYRASSWGWGIWRNKWKDIDWNVSDYKVYKNDFNQKVAFSKIGNDMPRMLRNQMNGKIDSWAIRMCYHQFKNNLITIFPAKSKIHHIGINEGATHTFGATKFNTPLDIGIDRSFEFDINPPENKKIIRDFKSKFSLKRRAADKIKRILRNFKP